VLLAAAAIAAGCVTSIVISLVANAQDEEVPHMSEFAGGLKCEYMVVKTNGSCGSVGSGDTICAPCKKPCPDYGGRNTQVNAKAPDLGAGCEVYVQLQGTACVQCSGNDSTLEKL
jgi:hypothetical protein